MSDATVEIQVVVGGKVVQRIIPNAFRSKNGNPGYHVNGKVNLPSVEAGADKDIMVKHQFSGWVTEVDESKQAKKTKPVSQTLS